MVSRAPPLVWKVLVASQTQFNNAPVQQEPAGLKVDINGTTTGPSKNVHLIVFDSETGLPYPKPYSNFDFYPDPTARHED